MEVLVLLVLSLALVVALAPLLIRLAYRAPRIVEERTPSDYGLSFREVRVPTVNGKTLFGWLIPPVQTISPAPAVAVIHGWGGNAEHMLPFADLLHETGIAVLLLDARNHGSSDSDGFSSMPRFAEDLEHGLDWLAKQPEIDPSRTALLGHSVGAGAALLVASRRQDLSAVISIAAFAHPATLMRRHMDAHHVPYLPVGWLILRIIERTIKARFDDIAPCNTIRKTGCPVLLIHGAKDASVPVEDAQQIYAHRRDERVRLSVIPDAGHESIEAIGMHGRLLVDFLHSKLIERRNIVEELRPH